MSKRTRPRPFWRSLSLSQLARQQGVKPVKNWEEVAKLWPADDDPDELLQFILRERAEQRKLVRKRR